MKTPKIYKEIDLTKLVSDKLPNIEDTILFINNPTKEDIEKASKDGKIVFSNKPSVATIKMVYELPERLRYFISLLHIDGLSDEELKEYVLQSIKKGYNMDSSDYPIQQKDIQ